MLCIRKPQIINAKRTLWHNPVNKMGYITSCCQKKRFSLSFNSAFWWWYGLRRSARKKMEHMNRTGDCVDNKFSAPAQDWFYEEIKWSVFSSIRNEGGKCLYWTSLPFLPFRPKTQPLLRTILYDDSWLGKESKICCNIFISNFDIFLCSWNIWISHTRIGTWSLLGVVFDGDVYLLWGGLRGKFLFRPKLQSGSTGNHSFVLTFSQKYFYKF